MICSYLYYGSNFQTGHRRMRRKSSLSVQFENENDITPSVITICSEKHTQMLKLPFQSNDKHPRCKSSFVIFLSSHPLLVYLIILVYSKLFCIDNGPSIKTNLSPSTY